MAPDLGPAAKAAEVLAVAAVAWLAYRWGWLTAGAAGIAFAMGAVIVLSQDFLWLLVLVALLALTAPATRFRYADKVARGTAEPRRGARRARNVLANGLAPTVVAALAPWLPGLGGPWDWGALAGLMFLSSVAVASADTLASELGSLSDRVYLITSLRRVPPGTDGGVSAAGQLAALLGALLIAGVGTFLLGAAAPALAARPALALAPASVAIPTLAGFAGCQLDSLLGATLEIRGLVSKEEVNALSIAAGALLGFVLGVLA